MTTRVLLLGITLGCSGGCVARRSVAGRALTSWEVRTSSDPGARWQVWHPPAPPPEARGDELWARTRLPLGSWRDPALKLGPVVMAFDVSIGGRRIYQAGDLTGTSTDPLTWRSWHLISLRPQDLGRTLTLHMRSRIWRPGFRVVPRVGSRADLLRDVVRRDVGAFAAGAFMLLIALLAAVASLWQPHPKLTVAFAGFAAAVGGYSLFYTQLKELVLDRPGLWLDIWVLSVSAAPVALLWLVENLFGPGRWRLVRRLRWLHVGLWAAQVVALYGLGWRSPIPHALRHAGWVVGLNGALWVAIRVVLIVDAAVIVTRLVRRARDDRDAQIFLGAVTVLALVMLRDVLVAAGLLMGGWHSPVHWGALALTVALGFIVVRRYVAQLRRYEMRLEAQGREREGMVRDLHDGIGSITTNISLLADLAGQHVADGIVQRTLTNIGQLAREGLAEIRYFMRSLDDDTTSWRLLAAELRRSGSKMIEAHGMHFVYRDVLDAPDARPPALVVLNLLRIYREALTNAVKHSGGSEVQVDLTVTTQALQLQVHDNGPGLGSKHPELGSGRGLGNMRGRARDLGGQLALRNGDGTTVELTIPIPRVSPEGGVSASS